MCELSTMQRLRNLTEEIKSNTKNHCEQLYQMRQDCTIAEKKKETICTHILKRVQQLVNKLEKNAGNDEVLSGMESLHDLTSEMKCLPTPDIHSAVKSSLIDFFRADSTFLHGKFEAKNLKEWGEYFVIEFHY